MEASTPPPSPSDSATFRSNASVVFVSRLFGPGGSSRGSVGKEGKTLSNFQICFRSTIIICKSVYGRTKAPVSRFPLPPVAPQCCYLSRQLAPVDGGKGDAGVRVVGVRLRKLCGFSRRRFVSSFVQISVRHGSSREKGFLVP